VCKRSCVWSMGLRRDVIADVAGGPSPRLHLVALRGFIVADCPTSTQPLVLASASSSARAILEHAKRKPSLILFELGVSRANHVRRRVDPGDPVWILVWILRGSCVDPGVDPAWILCGLWTNWTNLNRVTQRISLRLGDEQSWSREPSLRSRVL